MPWQPDKNDVTRDIASPFAYGKVRVDYPVLKEFSDAEIYEGMGDYVPRPCRTLATWQQQRQRRQRQQQRR